MTLTGSRVGSGWLALREAADARARADDLVGELLRGRATAGPTVVCDLGSGTGSMLRWLAPRLAGPQHWVLVDHDPALLAVAAGQQPPASADGAPVTVETRCQDLTRLSSDDLAGASLVTGSALLDVLSREEVYRLVTSCLAAGCPTLLTLSVTGRVALEPADPLDPHLCAAFNDHQRRTAGGRRLLGPDGAVVAASAFARGGATVETRRSGWWLAAADTELALSWLLGWVAAACQRRPELAPLAAAYLELRRGQADEGRLRVWVQHCDLLALPAEWAARGEPDEAGARTHGQQR
jgi:SAM-dependent methyltransferase